jgi:hypothetical protein
MFATLLIWLSAAVAILAIVDLFLSDSQKVWLSNAVTKTWNILDEAKGWSFADWLKKPRAKWWLAITLGLFLGVEQLRGLMGGVDPLRVFATGVAQRVPMDHPNYELISSYLDILVPNSLVITLMSAVAAMGGIFLSWFILAWLLKSNSGKLPVRRLVIAFVASLVFSLSIFFIFALSATRIEHPSSNKALVTLMVMLVLLAMTPVYVILCVIMIFVARALAYIASAILYVGEFVVRRIAEYPKGPVLALSVLFGSIVALIKAFG